MMRLDAAGEGFRARGRGPDMGGAGTVSVMAKRNKDKPKPADVPAPPPAGKKSDGGAHQTRRRNIALPDAWVDLADSLANEGPTPTAWWIIGLIRAAAEAAGRTDIPPVPWGRSKSPPGSPP